MKVFVSCVSQKHGHIVADISKVKEDNLTETFNTWKSITQPGTKPSRDVYRGTQWDLIKQLDSRVDTYVVSGGYGIIDLKTPIVPYSITLSSAYIDNQHLMVPKFDMDQKTANQTWWDSFGDFSSLWNDDEVCIFTVNPDYLNVLNLPEKDNIIILNNYRLGMLAKWLKSGVNNVAVNFALYLTQHHPNLSGNQELEQIYNTLVSKYGESVYQKRPRVTDDMLKEWIEEGKTLNALRNSGFGCSTQRFREFKNS